MPQQINWVVTLLPFAFALFLFGLTRLADFLRGQYRIKNEIIRNQLYLFKWIDLSVGPIHQQTVTLKKLVESINEDRFEDFRHNHIPVDKLKEVSSKDRLNIFFTNKKGEAEEKINAYYLLERSIDSLLIKEQHIAEVFAINRKAYFEISDEWNDSMHNFNNYSGRIVSENLRSKNIYIENMIAIMSNPEFKKPQSITYLLNNLVHHIADNVIKFYSTLPTDELFYTMSDTSRKLNICAEKYEKFKSTAINNFSTLSTELISANEKMQSAKTTIEKFEMKHLFFLK